MCLTVSHSSGPIIFPQFCFFPFLGLHSVINKSSTFLSFFSNMYYRGPCGFSFQVIHVFFINSLPVIIFKSRISIWFFQNDVYLLVGIFYLKGQYTFYFSNHLCLIWKYYLKSLVTAALKSFCETWHLSNVTYGHLHKLSAAQFLSGWATLFPVSFHVTQCFLVFQMSLW